MIAQDNASKQEKVEFTSELLHSMALELNAALVEEPDPAATKEEKKERKARQKKVRELGGESREACRV